MAEFDLIERIRQRAGAPRPDVVLGIGDDGALLRCAADAELVAVTDTLVEGVHFPVDTDPADIGWKALAVNLSDLAAMGATPAWTLLNLTAPAADTDFIDALMAGFHALAQVHQLALVGGDTCRGPLAVSVTALGFVPTGQALTRAGARVGDGVYVTGSLGDAAAALDALQSTADAAVVAPALLARLARPTPRLAAGQRLRGIAHAAIDVSDGLLADLGHVARASGVAIDIDAEALPLSVALRAIATVPAARDFALAGGDDYELAFTAPADAVLPALDCPVTRIGRVVAGSGVRALADGRTVIPARRAWEHFA